MLKKKNKDSLYAELINLACSENGNNTLNEEYKDLKAVYYLIKARYQEKIENEGMELNIEKARLENEKLKYQKPLSKAVKYIFTAIISMFLAFYLQSIDFIYTGAVIGDSSIDNLIDFLIKGILAAAIISFISHVVTYRKNKEKADINLLNNIKLKVIEDMLLNKLEEKIETEKVKIEFEKNNEEHEQGKEFNKANIVTDILMPAAFEVAASILKKDGILRKIFRRKK